jgi:hypothetical protein
MNSAPHWFGRFSLACALFVTAIVRTNGQSSLSNGLAAYYPFSGNAKDASGNGLDGTVAGATLTTDRFGLTNGAYRFNGGSWIQFPDEILPLTASELTVSFWVLADNGPHATQEELIDLSSRRGECGFAIMPGNPAMWNFGVHLQNSGWQVTESPMNPNIWTHLVGTYKQSQYIQFWVNGVLIQSNSVPDDTILVSPGYPLNTAIGIYDYSPSPYLGFNGEMDGLRIYNRALSNAEVQQLYQSEAPPAVSIIKAVKPAFSSLWVGTNYQLQVSGDLANWTNQGSPFAATNSSMIYPQYWDVDNWGRFFFRLQIAP